MSFQTFAVTYSPVPGFPAGSVVVNIVATITGTNPANNQTQTVAPNTASIVFANVVADTYQYSVAATDQAGNVFGTPVTGTFTATDNATVTLSIPASATVTQSG